MEHRVTVQTVLVRHVLRSVDSKHDTVRRTESCKKIRRLCGVGGKTMTEYGMTTGIGPLLMSNWPVIMRQTLCTSPAGLDVQPQTIDQAADCSEKRPCMGAWPNSCRKSVYLTVP